jgi:hypothetical protein
MDGQANGKTVAQTNRHKVLSVGIVWAAFYFCGCCELERERERRKKKRGEKKRKEEIRKEKRRKDSKKKKEKNV